MARPKGKLTAADEAIIRNLLNLGRNQPFPRCTFRSEKKRKAFEKAGDFSHSDRLHVCDECRCDNVAGSHSHGDFYQIGRPDLGAYGVGPCGKCAAGQRRDQIEKYRREHLSALQNFGTPSSVAEIEQTAVADANRSEQNIEVRDAINQVRDLIREMDELERGEGLTEKGSAGPQPMSDATRIKLKMDRARLLNELGKTKFDLSRDLMIPVDILNLWVRDTIILAQEVCVTRDDYDKFVRKFKAIIMNTRNQSMTKAAVGVGAELMEKRANDE